MEINPKRFYTIGMYAFFIMGVMNTMSFITFFNQMIIYDQVSRVMGIMFNFALFGFFLYLKRQLPDIDMKDLATEDDMGEMLKKLEKKK